MKTSGTFAGLDRFNRIVDNRWCTDSGTPTDLDRCQYGYDRHSSPLWKQNLVQTSNFDEAYTFDNINRLTQMRRGTLSGSHVIAGTPNREQDWTLDPVGNWSAYITKAAGTTDLDQSRTASTVNEITDIDTNTVGLPVWATPGYDDAGNMTDFVKPSDPTANLTGTYDAWNRLVEIKDGTDTVAQYSYDGLTRRITKKTYVSGVLSETREYYFSDQWQVLDEIVSGTVEASYVWGMRYVDELVLRNTSKFGHTYAMQDAEYDCTAICNASGSVLERYELDPYGNRAVFDASWSSKSATTYGWYIAHQGLSLETDVGLYSCRNRVYSPNLGVWLQRDPVGYVDGMNLYEYETSNPIYSLDPMGYGVNWPYPRVPCGTAQRKASCKRWATQKCQARGGCCRSAACCKKCIDTAAACCAGSGCNRVGRAGKCVAQGVRAMAECNGRPTPAESAKCFLTCLNSGMSSLPCAYSCSACKALIGPGAWGVCLAACAIAPFVPPPIGGAAFVPCMISCIGLAVIVSILPCSACMVCIGNLTTYCDDLCS